jgi:hypothetical protein
MFVKGFGRNFSYGSSENQKKLTLNSRFLVFPQKTRPMPICFGVPVGLDES